MRTRPVSVFSSAVRLGRGSASAVLYAEPLSPRTSHWLLRRRSFATRQYLQRSAALLHSMAPPSQQLRAEIGEGVGGSLEEWLDPEFAAAWTETGQITTNPDRLRQVELLASGAVAAAKATGAPRILDLACGSGLVTEALFGRGCEVVGVDGSEAMLNIAAVKVPSVTFAQATFEELADGSESSTAAAVLKGPFGAITVAQALHEADDKAVRGILRWAQQPGVLAPGGVLLVLERYELESGGAEAAGIWCGRQFRALLVVT